MVETLTDHMWYLFPDCILRVKQSGQQRGTPPIHDMRSIAAGLLRSQQNTDYIHLPAIVESAESSPNAAKEAAHRIRKFLADPTSTPGSIHYNAIMLIRILIDNPGHTFARNLDAKFASTVKDLLRQGRDMGVQQFLRETLEFMESQRSWDEDLASMVQMWNKEKGRYQKVHTLLVRWTGYHSVTCGVSVTNGVC